MFFDKLLWVQLSSQNKVPENNIGICTYFSILNYTNRQAILAESKRVKRQLKVNETMHYTERMEQKNAIANSMPRNRAITIRIKANSKNIELICM